MRMCPFDKLTGEFFRQGIHDKSRRVKGIHQSFQISIPLTREGM